jgi:hypothetical protein
MLFLVAIGLPFMPYVIRFIGDIHGQFEIYEKIIAGAGTSIQVGDMGIASVLSPVSRTAPSPRSRRTRRWRGVITVSFEAIMTT